MPIVSSGELAEPPRRSGPPFGGRRPSWHARRGGYPAAWAAAGLILLCCGVMAVLPGAGARHRTHRAFCGLVACDALHSAAAAAGVPTADPRPLPAPWSLLGPSPRPATRAAAGTAALVPAPSPVPAPTPVPGPVPSPTSIWTSPAAPPAPTTATPTTTDPVITAAAPAAASPATPGQARPLALPQTWTPPRWTPPRWTSPPGWPPSQPWPGRWSPDGGPGHRQPPWR